MADSSVATPVVSSQPPGKEEHGGGGEGGGDSERDDGGGGVLTESQREVLEKCLHALKHAKNDSHTLAALLLVSVWLATVKLTLASPLKSKRYTSNSY